ncbi:MAG: hypothetical protein HFG39_05485 [Lachnospiraceae bacterium]|nr:hypothetical protein [Lachnospiraceae bacterium]
MLLVQDIVLEWGKRERGVEGERIRRRFPLAYLLEEKQGVGEVLVNRVDFCQKGKEIIDSQKGICQFLEEYLPQLGFTKKQIQEEIQKRICWIRKHRLQEYGSIEEINLANLFVSGKKEAIEIGFFYDEQRSGRPVRKGHNRDFWDPCSPLYGKDILNEKAFVLKQNQYGRIIWNERRTDYDTGEWYYQLHIYNFIYLLDHTFSKDIFMKKKPDFEYKQLARLW